ncbi:MAG: serpin family protein [Nitrospinae bacterium]|nr:serpin family protein [Nitrospinota bacterium]
MESFGHGINKFAINLYSRLVSSEKNLFFSPYSIFCALALSHAGAAGRTLEHMSAVMSFPMDGDKMHCLNGKLMASLTRTHEEAEYKLKVANSLWLQEGYPILEKYVQFIEETYHAAPRAADFETSVESARQSINRWVEDLTENLIRDLIPPDTLSELTRLILVNAMYFKGYWVFAFDEELTQEKPFKRGLSGGGERPVPMMFQTDEFWYMEEEDFQVLQLPYAGGDLAMLAILPREVDGLESIEKNLAAGNLEDWISKLRRETVQALLPKFKLSAGMMLGNVLRKMGMNDAFSPEAADFSKITQREKIYLSEVAHQAFVEVNEKSTEAAATAGIVDGLGEPEEPPKIYFFRADHPFVFMIRDQNSGSILFLGCLVDPE